MTDVIASHNFLNFFNTTKTSAIIGVINSTFSGGAVFGALFGGVIMDGHGRKRTITVGGVICTVGAIVQAARLSSIHDPPRPHSDWLLCRCVVHERACMPVQVCTSEGARLDCRSCPADDWSRYVTTTKAKPSEADIL